MDFYRFRFSCRSRSWTRIWKRDSDAGPVGWPASVRGTLLQSGEEPTPADFDDKNRFLSLATIRIATFMAFELQPTLKGELVELRPLRQEDFEAIYAVACDPLIWEQHPNPDRYKEAVFREFFRGAMESVGAFLVSDAKSGEVIGSSRFAHYGAEAGQIEIGWTFLARSHWGGSYNREMKELMLDHAFKFVKSVVFTVGTANFRSQRALEKIGAVRERTKTGDGPGADRFIYRITPANLRIAGG
jgi:RimJ/RimL family protein N-acetyltransferase